MILQVSYNGIFLQHEIVAACQEKVTPQVYDKEATAIVEVGGLY